MDFIICLQMMHGGRWRNIVQMTLWDFITFGLLEKVPFRVIKFNMFNFKTGTRHFTRDFVLVLASLVIIVIAAMAYFSTQANHDISQKYILDSAERAKGKYEALTESILRDLNLVRNWGVAGKLSLADTDGLNGLFFPLLKKNRILFGISVVDTDGESYYVNEVDTGWRSNRTGASEAGRSSIQRFWNADQRMISEEKMPSQYDPRRRPWFFPALSTDGAFWTPPYKFYDREDVGITVSMACGKEDDQIQLVAAFDVMLDDLFKEILRMEPSENSKVIILSQDGHLYVARSQDASPDFTTLAQVKNPLVQKVYAYWESTERPSSGTFPIRHDNERWWSGFRPLDSASQAIWVGVMVPESDIIGDIYQRRAVLWSVAGAIIIITGVFALWMIRRYGPSAEGGDNQFDPKAPRESIHHLIAAGEGPTIEFKSTMRMNLRTQKPGKEIELAWLKAVAAFMNTDGGTLLLGVSDDGQITGLEQDGFANEDKCRLHFKNLISQHIGAELSKYLHFTIVPIDNKLVGVVSCARSSEPTYLKTSKKESFYIRNGPSSDELPVSKAVAYIGNRE